MSDDLKKLNAYKAQRVVHDIAMSLGDKVSGTWTWVRHAITGEEGRVVQVERNALRHRLWKTETVCSCGTEEGNVIVNVNGARREWPLEYVVIAQDPLEDPVEGEGDY